MGSGVKDEHTRKSPCPKGVENPVHCSTRDSVNLKYSCVTADAPRCLRCNTSGRLIFLSNFLVLGTCLHSAGTRVLAGGSWEALTNLRTGGRGTLRPGSFGEFTRIWRYIFFGKSEKMIALARSPSRFIAELKPAIKLKARNKTQKA